MTHEEKIRLYDLADKTRAAGNIEEAEKIEALIPLYPIVAKIGKEVYGAECLQSGSYNLSEAEDVYGKDWLTK